MKRKPIKSLRNKLWKLISNHVRLAAANRDGFAECVTCGTAKSWKELHAGHFIPAAKGNAIRWDTRGIHPQCYRCNINLQGNWPAYYEYMKDRYGLEVIDELIVKSNVVLKLTALDYEQMIAEYL